jgi:hypothetical protein
MDKRAFRFVDLRSAALCISSAKSPICRNSKIFYSAAQNVPQRSAFPTSHIAHRIVRQDDWRPRRVAAWKLAVGFNSVKAAVDPQR